MPRKTTEAGRLDDPATRRLAWAFLLVSFFVSLAFLAARNIYDDEIGTTDLLRVPTREIVRSINRTDVHPPGMYVLAHWGYGLIPSPRWVTLFPLLCLYAGLAVFVLRVAPLFRDRWARLCFLLLATLHPQLLMWGNSIRWYPWWTGVALATVVVALRPSLPGAARLSAGRAVSVGLLLGGLFYLNYITILFSLGLIGAMLLRYGWIVWRPLLLTGLVGTLLVSPQLTPFLTVHMAGSGGQRSGAALSFARLAQGLSSSEAFLPWHPVAILATLIFLQIGLLGLVAARRYLRRRTEALGSGPDAGMASLIVLSLLFAGLVVVSGLGGKPRNALALVPLLAPAEALALASLRRPLVCRAVLGVLAVWCGWGIAHLLLREGLTKSGMNNRPEEVLRLIERTRGPACAVVVTYDPILTFYLVESRQPLLEVLTLTQNRMYTDALPFPPAACPEMRLYVVRSFLGGFGGYETILPAELDEAARAIEGPAREQGLSFDPDARIKRRFHFSGGETLPEYRYDVRYGAMDPAQLQHLREHLAFFTVADGRSRARLQRP
jgi:hypothetical protein